MKYKARASYTRISTDLIVLSGRRRKTFALFAIIALLLMTANANIDAAENDTPTESEIKAAMIYNFAQFVEWPESDFKLSQSPFVVGVFGEDPIGAILVETLKGETFQNRKVQVRQLSVLSDVKACQILYVSPSQKKHTSEIFELVRGESVLTIGDTEDFTQLGGMIAFKKDGNKMRFLINPSAATRAGLKISSKLLHLAIVEDDGGAKGSS